MFLKSEVLCVINVKSYTSAVAAMMASGVFIFVLRLNTMVCSSHWLVNPASRRGFAFSANQQVLFGVKQSRNKKNRQANARKAQAIFT